MQLIRLRACKRMHRAKRRMVRSLQGLSSLKLHSPSCGATCKQERKALRSWCDIHQGWCYTAPSQRLQDYEENGVRVIWMEISGNSCTPWSAAGSQTGWLHPASVAAVAYGFFLSLSAPCLVVKENTPRFPSFHLNVLVPHKAGISRA